MTTLRTFCLSLILSAAAAGHADIVLTRAPGAGEVTIQNCTQAESAQTCSVTESMSLRQLKRVRNRIEWMSFGRLLAFSLATPPMYVPMPTYLQQEYTGLRSVSAQLQALIKGKSTAVTVPTAGPAGPEILGIFERTLNRVGHPPVG